MLKVYTDGAVSGNGYVGSKGGWAYAIINDENEVVKENAQFFKETTNNRMEMIAVLEGIIGAINYNKEVDKIEVYTDSAYIVNCYKDKWYIKWMQNGWTNSKRQAVINKDLWLQLVPYFSNPKIEIIKVEGHSEDIWNKYVDAAAVKIKKELDIE